MPAIPKLNEIIFYKKRNFISLGVVYEISGDRYTLITEEGKQLIIEAEQVVYCSKITSEKIGNSSEIKLELRSLRKELDIERKSIDLKTIWECLYDPDISSGYKLQDILDLYIDGNSNYKKTLLFVWAMQRDETYFKKLGGTIYLNSLEEIQEVIKRKEEAEKKASEKVQAIKWFKDLIDGSIDAKDDDIDKYSQYLELIKGYAISIDKYERLKEAKSLLNEVGLKDEISALQFLIKIGLWDEKEDPLYKRFGIKETYPQKVIKESNELVQKDVTYDRFLDISKLELFSIDDENTKDIDDALSVELLDDKTRIGVHISNVASVIESSSALDKEALKRGETIYLPEGSIPMFPPEMVEKLLTLSEKNTRKAVSLFITFDADFNISNYEFIQTKINVKRNISYKEANEIFLKSQQGKRLLDISRDLREKRVKNGAVILQLPTMKIVVDGDNVESISKYSMTTDSHNIISEFMVLLNNLAARYFSENKIPAVFRSQIDNTSVDINSLDRDSELFPIEVIRYLRPTKITTIAEPHKFLGIDAYVQVSSPIRRYLDLVLQRQLISCLNGTGPIYGDSALEKIYSQTEMAVKEKRLIEKSRERYWILKYLSDNGISELQGIISSVRDKRVTVYVPEFLLDMPIALSSDSQLVVGNKVKISINKIDLLRRKILASFID
jgi:exoribonuclease-2